MMVTDMVHLEISKDHEAVKTKHVVRPPRVLPSTVTIPCLGSVDWLFKT